MNTPLLLIVWRRPHTLRQVIDAIRPVAPTRLYVACDGPNPERPGEDEKVAATRSVIEQEIDWPCQIERFYSDVNQGCRLGVIRAITWFFEQVEEGIILEDDCVPHPDFFAYCTNLLECYRHDTRVWSICGSNFQLGNKQGNASYYFSIHGDSWGWATWRRAWMHYHQAEEGWNEIESSQRLSDIFWIPQERDYWLGIFREAFGQKKTDTWDIQWWLTCWINSALHAWPNNSLIDNIGFGQDSTHTSGNNIFSKHSEGGLPEIIHPAFVLPSREADEHAFLYRRRGLASVEKAKFGLLYPIIIRARIIHSEGFRGYAKRKLRRALFGA